MELLLAVGSVWLFLWINTLVHELAHLYFIRKYNVPCLSMSIGGDTLKLRINNFTVYLGLGLNGYCAVLSSAERSVSEWRKVIGAGPLASVVYGLVVVLLCSLFANSVFPYIAGIFIFCLLSLLESARENGQDLNTLRILSKTTQKELTLGQLFA